MNTEINRLSMREILNIIGFPIFKNEFRNTYKFNVNINVAKEFEGQLMLIRDIMDIEKAICKYEEIFDKEMYVFHTARLLEQDIENLKRVEILGDKNLKQQVFIKDTTKQKKRRAFVDAKKLLKTSDVVDIEMKKKSKGEFEVHSSIDFVDERLLEANNRITIIEEKLYKIEEQIGLSKVLSLLKNSDLLEICKYPNLAVLLVTNQDKFEKKFKKYFQYMDIEKTLILANAIYFNRYKANLDKINKEDAIRLKRFTLAVEEIVGENVKTIKTTRFDFIVDFNEIKNTVKNLVSDEEVLQSILDEKKEKQLRNDSLKNEKEHENKTEPVQEEVEEPKKTEYIIKFINEENRSIVDADNIRETIMKIDKDTTVEETNDGSNLYALPNQKCYIIQPLNKSFYANATYVIGKDFFETEKNTIIKDKSVDILELESLKSTNSNVITKLVHTGWENSLETFFNMRKEEKYTKEEVKNIEKIVYNIK